MKIVEAPASGSKLSNIVPKLRGFHTMMSFLGSVGYIVEGSELREVLELLYAPNTVPHLLSGKAITRVIRGHFLVDAPLHAILISEVLLEKSSSVAESILQPEEILELRNVHKAYEQRSSHCGYKRKPFPGKK